ncbi:DUF4381 domain-containing protein [Vibrio ulleungensis]|uniref:DUF4381 domain-containing protein n=1 Tax=Vibrio ulleungensis TaxID=2807619 RepID=A0ABS2HFL5_9VIBR|nr:DUF4381 domain-containing protein [Vibrio ulleungensis]MBM7035182.1 DUF4381 domain-containing protein [Vibrio ulleungensis]
MSDGIENLHPQGITPLTSGLMEPSLPEPISWIPDAPGWWVVIGLLAAYVIYQLVRLYRHYQRNAYRRAAIKALSEIGLNSDQVAMIPLLIRRTALYAYPREDVAPLVGQSWEEWLDARCPGSDFSVKHAGLLSRLAYSHQVDESQQQLLSLREAVAFWIKHHEVAQ